MKSQFIENFKLLSTSQLRDTANYYFGKNSVDTALLCYSLIINAPAKKDADTEHQQTLIEAYNRSAIMYNDLCDYRTSYELLIKALLLSEKYNDRAGEAKVYTNIGNIYYRFHKFDIAKSFYSKALQLCKDSIGIVIILNNLGSIEVETGNLDSAYYLLNTSLQISKRHKNNRLYGMFNNLALLYQKEQKHHLAYTYFQLSLSEAQKNNEIEMTAQNLSDLGKLFFELKKLDSTLFYIDQSNVLASKNNFLRILAENYLLLSKIEELKGNNKNALAHFKSCANLNDSVFNAKNFGEINQLQRLYEVSKTNQQIEQLAIEQHIKERTIHYQKIIQFITLFILLSVSISLLYIYLQKRNLSRAYKLLFVKNVEIMGLQENLSKKNAIKYKKSALTHNMQDELLDKILQVMDNPSIICDTEFSLDKLAEIVHSNHAYVSQVINTALKKNFRSFLNSYRIREAQRFFSDAEASKYTIDSVALRLGFKSPSTFRDAFKEITGVSPNFYLKSMQEQTFFSTNL